MMKETYPMNKYKTINATQFLTQKKKEARDG